MLVEWKNTSLVLPLHLNRVDQGCIRPRPSPFWRPSTRYNGVSDPLRGGGSIAGFRAEGGFDFRVRRFRKFWGFFENFTKLMYLKSIKIAFQWHFGWTHFCVRTSKKYQVFVRTLKIHISAFGRQFSAKKDHNWTNDA